MKFYIDFEATQFSNRIISIGCIAEDGSMFQSYVKLFKGDKLTKFITDLTGITKEILQEAPDGNEVFNKLGNWINSFNSNQNTFYCFGDCDSQFIENTIRKMSDINSINIATYILDNLIDYSKTISQMFNINFTPNLYRTYLLGQEKTEEQKHDSLEDAIILKNIEENSHCNYFINKLSKYFEHQFNWEGQNKKNSITRGNEQDYVIAVKFRGRKKVHKKKADYTIKYFSSLEEATYWIIYFYCSSNEGVSKKNKEQVKEIAKNIAEAAENNEFKYSVHWIKNPTQEIKWKEVE